MRFVQLAGALALVALGGVAGYTVRVPAAAPPPKPVATAAVAPRPLSVVAAAGPSADELRAIVREELAATRADSPADERAAQPPPSEAALRAVADAERHLDGAVVAGVWHDGDRATFRALLAEVPEAERGRLIARLAQSINEGKIHFETSGSPL